ANGVALAEVGLPDPRATLSGVAVLPGKEGGVLYRAGNALHLVRLKQVEEEVGWRGGPPVTPAVWAGGIAKAGEKKRRIRHVVEQEWKHQEPEVLTSAGWSVPVVALRPDGGRLIVFAAVTLEGHALVALDERGKLVGRRSIGDPG